MITKEILNTVAHRPWPIAQKPWSYYQEWNRAIFLHWEVNYDELRKLVPSELEIDLIDGKPWVSLVAFTMENIRPKFLPAFPPISNFDEINVRTYVKVDGKAGVHFLSIEAGNKLSCMVAKTMSELPYRFSKMSRTKSTFTSVNSILEDHFSVNFELGKPQEKKTPLDKWLTERYALYQQGAKGINKFEIHHLEWELRSVSLEKLEYNYSRFDNLFSGSPVHVHYSEGVQVIAWDKEN